MVVYKKIDLHFECILTRYPVISYSDGVEQRFEDIDYARIHKNEFVVFLERFANEKCVNIYYCMPDIRFPEALRIIATDIKYVDLIEIGYLWLYTSRLHGSSWC